MNEIQVSNMPGVLTTTMPGATPGGPPIFPAASSGLNAGELSGLLARSIEQSLALRRARQEEELAAARQERALRLRDAQWQATDRRERKFEAAQKPREAPRAPDPVDPYQQKLRATFTAANAFANYNPAGADVGVRGTGREPAGTMGLRSAGNYFGADGLSAVDLQAALAQRGYGIRR